MSPESAFSALKSKLEEKKRGTPWSRVLEPPSLGKKIQDLAISGDVTTLTEELKTVDTIGGVDHAKNRYGTTALMSAASNGHVDALKLLLTVKADPTLQDEFKYSSLMYAARNGHPNCVQTLLDTSPVGDILNQTDSNHQTALMWAVMEGEEMGAGHVECVRLLLAAKADVTTKNKSERTAAFFARNHPDCLKLLTPDS